MSGMQQLTALNFLSTKIFYYYLFLPGVFLLCFTDILLILHPMDVKKCIYIRETSQVNDFHFRKILPKNITAAICDVQMLTNMKGFSFKFFVVKIVICT